VNSPSPRRPVRVPPRRPDRRAPYRPDKILPDDFPLGWCVGVIGFAILVQLILTPFYRARFTRFVPVANALGLLVLLLIPLGLAIHYILRFLRSRPKPPSSPPRP
jgi:hypothetical protein